MQLLRGVVEMRNLKELKLDKVFRNKDSKCPSVEYEIESIIKDRIKEL